MSWLLAKDRPWVYGGAVAGAGGLAGALFERPADHVFVIGVDRLEAAFHVAWIAGLVLGAVAACFDEVLGTRELLRQRPLSRSSLVAARLRGVLVALLAWLVMAPFAAWVGGLVFGDAEGALRLAAVGVVLATFVVGASAAGIGLAAGSLPAPWWQRLAAAAACFAASFALVHELARDARGETRMAMFVAGHLAVAALFVVVAAVAARHDADADRPWPPRVRWLAALPVVAALAVLWAPFCGEAQNAAARRVERAYPEIVRLGDRFVLARTLGESRARELVDPDHRPTGERLDALPPGSETWRPEASWWGRSFGFDAPRWHRGSCTAWTSFAAVTLAADGRAWVRRLPQGLRATGQGTGHAPFAPDSYVATIGDAIVAVDASTGQPWRFDARLEHFVPLSLPANERALEHAAMRLDEPGDERWKTMLEGPERRWESPIVLRGERDAYVVRDGALAAVPGLLARLDHERVRNRQRDALRPRFAEDGDPLVQRLEVPPGTVPAAFVHEFRPRTLRERLHAGTAMAWSLVRPPLLQVAGSFAPRSDRAPWLFDRLTIDGRRPWLVFATCLLAGFGAWSTRRRLRSLDAAPATVHGWTVTVALLGLPAVLVSLAMEHRRRYARREVAVPPPAPRIVSPLPDDLPENLPGEVPA